MKLLKVDSLEDAENKLEKYFKNIEKKTEQVSLDHCAGRYLAQDIAADMDMPSFRRSVVDGYALKASDTFGVSDSLPVFLKLVGEVEMGFACEHLICSGQAAYVPTGGMIPSGADAVVMVEYSEKLDDHTVAVYKAASPGGGLTEIGDDFRAGELFFRKGHRIKEKDIGILAALGIAELSVYSPPCLSVFSTGDEIIPVSQLPSVGEIRDINRHGIAALAQSVGVKICGNSYQNSYQNISKSENSAAGDIIHPIVKDDLHALRINLQSCLAQSDIVILSGGSSAGTKDMTAQIIDEAGKPGVITHGLAMKPGKPTIIGIVDGKAVFGLPGHPAAALIVFKAVVEPFIKKYYFGCTEHAAEVNAVTTENIHAGEGRETFQLVRLRETNGEREAEPVLAKSGAISQLARADGYVRIPSLSEGLHRGQTVKVTLL